MTSTPLLRLRAIALALRGDGLVDSTLSTAGLKRSREADVIQYGTF